VLALLCPPKGYFRPMHGKGGIRVGEYDRCSRRKSTEASGRTDGSQMTSVSWSIDVTDRDEFAGWEAWMKLLQDL